jgi:phosphotransferase system IIB component
MNRVTRTTIALAAAAALTPALRAQIPGMPLFTNPRYATGLRIGADIGQPTSKGTSLGDLTVIQGGASFVLGPIGIGANVGMLRDNITNLTTCNTTTGVNCNTNSKVTASVLGQLRVMGGGSSNLSLSIFGGASTDLTAYDALNCAGLTGAALIYCSAKRDSMTVKQITIPVGAALGLKIPLGIASLSLWGAPRMNFTKFSNCAGTCPASGSGKFRWAMGADFPIFHILSIRAAYDTGKDFSDQTTSVWGIGASIGFGGMR